MVCVCMCDSVQGVDEARQLVYFTGNKGQPTEQHLFVASLLGCCDKADCCDDSCALCTRRLTDEPGCHSCTLNMHNQVVVDVFR